MINKVQSGDVLMYQGPDNGEISVEDGIIEMTTGFETMLYLILMGPNEGDDGTPATVKAQWLGNEGEPPESVLRGRFHTRLENYPITSGNLLELQRAAVDDITEGFGDLLSSVTVFVTAKSSNSVEVSGTIEMTTGAVMPYRLELFR